MTIMARRRGIAQFEATVREFSEALEKSRARTAQLRGPAKALVHDPEALDVVLEELHAQQEELNVADEELRAQLEELTLTSKRARAERDHYRELFDLSPDGYFVTDRLGVIRDVNAAGAQMANADARFLVGKPLAALVDLADARILRGGIDRLATTTTIELELRLRPRGGESVWHTIKATSIESGTALLWIARDAHGLHPTPPRASSPGQADGGVSERLAELERANRDKDELLERERRLREELMAADAAKDRFIGVLSHDLRAPLNAVIGWTQLLRREPLDHATRDRALATIERNAHAQVRLVEELLDISRIASNRLQLERRTLDLSDLVRRAAESALPAARECGIELDSVVSDGVVVFGDRARLEQVMSHLLSNALKLTPTGGRVIVLLERDAPHARITVQDTGRGIAPETLPFVFEPFRQTSALPSMADGLGVGLYIVRRAVEMHGGRVSAQSDGLGRGARFTVLLPIISSTAPPPEADAAASSAQAELEGIRVLVVDDDDDRRELLAALLQQKGAAVTSASDVASALLVFDASPPDVVVTDLAMPGRGGLDLVRDLRARGENAALVAISGLAAPEDIASALAAGFDVHIAKPVDPSELVAAVGEAARGRRR